MSSNEYEFEHRSFENSALLRTHSMNSPELTVRVIISLGGTGAKVERLAYFAKSQSLADFG